MLYLHNCMLYLSTTAATGTRIHALRATSEARLQQLVYELKSAFVIGDLKMQGTA